MHGAEDGRVRPDGQAKREHDDEAGSWIPAQEADCALKILEKARHATPFHSRGLMGTGPFQ
jgi:hypothetical protein